MLAAVFALFAIATSAQTDHRGCHMVGFRSLSELDIVSNVGGKRTYTKVVPAGLAWDELVPSWNVALPKHGIIALYARPLYPDATAKPYCLGRWQPGKGRKSITGQKDEHGNVYTDTLVLKRRASAVEITLEIYCRGSAPARFKLLALHFRDSTWSGSELEPNRAAWGKQIDVVPQSQLIWPNGSNLCSPTSVSMLLSYWAREMDRPGLAKIVPLVQKGVFDRNWPGTGNWPFNTAYAGAFTGMTGYVSRLSDVSELEDWIAAGIPVACSVSYNMLQGKPRGADDGHLVVLMGFTSQGDPIVNDPGWSRELRHTYRREDLAKAWATSGRTVYLIYPSDRQPPADRFGHWIR